MLGSFLERFGPFIWYIGAIVHLWFEILIQCGQKFNSVGKFNSIGKCSIQFAQVQSGPVGIFFSLCCLSGGWPLGTVRYVQASVPTFEQLSPGFLFALFILFYYRFFI